MKYILSLFAFILTISICYGQSKTLDEYLQQALKNSPLIKDLNNQVLAAQIDSVRILAGFKPQVALNAGGLYAPVIKGYGYAAAITNERTLNGQLTVSKTFIGNNYLNTQFAAIGLSQDSLRNSVKLSEQDLRRTIIGQYITAYGSLQQQQFNQEVVDLLTKEEELLKKLTRSNVYRQSDYLTFLVTLKGAQLQLSQTKLQYKTDYATLNYLSGIADTTISEIAKPELQRAVVYDRSNSIFFKQYQLDSMRLANSRKLIDYSYRPKLSAFADGGYNSDLTSQYYKNFGASVGFSLTMPIYDGGQKKLAYKKLSLEQETQQVYKAFYFNQYKQQINQLNQQIREYDKLIAEINEQFKYSESLIKVNTQLMQTGDLKIADLILAINSYLSIKNQLAQNVISRLQLINQLNYWSR
ncbi:TolC family protein [Mucilaginibacter sp. ZT4R22]|uniref:TolC family protein n=1 Tax=Mucilaginibacter pankratovii TaxID=2772110 RepID=A0ABR7WX13_9SPHI|nr:TolC family protein [Mucilaginibacter pankratovii]MBD1366831.1 TolC family protein [Mucilaginibacter pankratovii]